MKSVYCRSRPAGTVVGAVGASIAASAAADAKYIVEEEQITQVIWEGGHSQSQVLNCSNFLLWIS